MDAKPDTYQGPELDEAVAERIAQMSASERYDYFCLWAAIGCRPYGFNFDEWLRDKIAREV
jgi:hypothetical protein